MIETEWWDYDSPAELAEAVAGDVAFLIESALDARGDAVIAVPGDAVAAPVLDLLKRSRLGWKDVTLLPTDDRLVSVESPQSAARLLAERFLALGARVLPLTNGDLPPREAGRAADARLQALHWPLDLVWLGMGADGEAASILPGPDLEAALTAPHRAVGVVPDPMPEAAPFARVTLTRSAILAARSILIVVQGDEARAVLEQALAEGSGARAPIGLVLADATQAIDIHWCA